MDFTYLLRPKSFDDVIGQEHLCSKNAPLRVLCEKSSLIHSFFHGPSGVGKTTIARIIANVLELPFYELNATTFKIDELRKIITQYKNALTRPLIFIDEVHRLSKNQQEVLLPFMEKNTILVIGASTENPFFSLTSAIRSRSMLFELKTINAKSLHQLLNIVVDKYALHVEDEAKEYLVHSSGGDARSMLKLLEVTSALHSHISLELLKSLRPNALSAGSSEATVHYDLASALIKSIRGSDEDASIYYLARLIEGGESADFIARRLVILASEDVGNANPQALTLCNSCLQSVSKIGYPEARIILAQTVLYLVASPKSNASYSAINKALQMVKDGVMLDIPEHLKQQHTGYIYPHDYGGYVKQNYLSKPLHVVELKEVGYEAKMKKFLSELK
ncbi:MAG: replication-associated recombination protein A [Campylobacterota bacterium]|nr:replication-associated recombination protein A [Campylobacterota bacterium]